MPAVNLEVIMPQRYNPSWRLKHVLRGLRAQIKLVNQIQKGTNSF